ncbi:MAG: AarF/ABC1/UbiB kinase family protein [Bacteroidia bacterium]|nr:AarF/ABC1/UbiB kinase family protein [Bacteroidia bacterium]MCF8426513.1 AarF/ABC1/UbiB kinase family protein [Bacteroidia bacterium]MCF8448027.1 AarF/ABC1/UbiB kinase family protein [Bacteroidia bacterium]
MTFKHLKRYKYVLQVLMKHGLDDMMAHSSLKKFLPKIKLHRKIKGELSKVSYSRYQRIRMALEELGPTYIKFGQILSNRPDLLPVELIDELKKLQDSVPCFPFSSVKTIIETDLNGSLDELFHSFEETPIASASIAQVHLAKLHTGEIVVLKVQRPDIEEMIEEDLKILGDLAEIAEHNFPQIARFEPIELVKSLDKSMNRELNFLLEAYNINHFRHLFANDEKVYAPKVYSKYSTRRVICLEYIDGIKLNQLEKLRAQNIDLSQLAEQGLYIYFQQIFRFGFFHADPHPGNVFVLRDGRICLLDFGMVGTMNRKDKEAFKNFIIAIAKGDLRNLTDAIEQLSNRKKSINKSELEYDISILIEEFPPETIDERNMGEIVDRLQKIIFKHKLSFSNDFFLLLRALVILDGISRQLDPKFNTLERIRKHSFRLFEEGLEPKNLLKSALQEMVDIWDFVRVLPADFKGILNRIKEGKVKLEFIGLNQLLHTLDVISNRLSAAIILAAMILGSSMVVLSQIPPLWKGIPIIGLIGIIVSGIFGSMMLFSIYKNGKF